MNSKTITAAIIVSIFGSISAAAQSADDLLKDHKLLNAELDRCRTMGMESNDDTRCKTAREAEQKRFFGNGVGYTPSKPVEVPPGHEQFNPQPNSPKPQPSTSGPPNGQ